jgi:adenylate cyclase
VSRDLGVKYILEGSVRKVGNRVRVTTQLIDGLTGHNLWAERYDRQLEAIFAIQDEITFKILKEIQAKLTEGEQTLLYSKGTENIDAYVKFWQGRSYCFHFDKGSNAVARQLLAEAIALDPNWEPPYSWVGWTHLLDAAYGYSANREESVKQAIQCAQKALSFNESSVPHSLLSFTYMITGQHDKALEEGEKSIALGPNSADAHAWYAQPLVFAGEPAKGISSVEKALRMNPFPPCWYYNGLFWGYFSLRNYERAMQACMKGINIEPTNIRLHLNLVLAYVMLGFEKEAHAQAQEAQSIYPSLSFEYFPKTLPFKDQSEIERIVDALHKAGLK